MNLTLSLERNAARLLSCAAAILAALACVGPAAALDEPPGEKRALKACEKRLCTMILEKPEEGADLTCDIQKTWAKSSLEGGKSKGVSWGFGDARCEVDLTLSRADLVSALTRPSFTVKIPAQQVHCILERDGEIKPVKARLAPKLEFKKGRAEKVWINLEDIEGPDDVKSTIWTAAQLEDTLGIFHRPLIKSINKFMHKQCAKRYGPGAEANADDEDEETTKVAADKSAKAKDAKTPAKASKAPDKATPAQAATGP